MAKHGLPGQLDTICRELEWWLDYQETGRAKEGLTSDDDDVLMRPAKWPTRGMMKAWIAALREAEAAIEAAPVTLNELREEAAKMLPDIKTYNALLGRKTDG